MDKKDTLRNLLIAGAVFVVVMAVAPRLIPVTPPLSDPNSPIGTDGAEPTVPMSGNGDGSAVGAVVQPTAASDRSPVDAQTYVVREVDLEQFISIGAGETDGIDKKNPGPFRMRLKISNVGASVESATMTDHADTLGSVERYKLLSMIERPDGARFRSLAVGKINIDGATDIRLDDKRWHMEPVEQLDASGDAPASQSVTMWIEIHRGDVPAFRVTRRFTLPEQPIELGRHDVDSSITIENLLPEPHNIVLSYGGGLGVPTVNPRMQEPFIDCGVRSSDGRIIGSRKTAAELAQEAAKSFRLYTPNPKDPETRLSWAATANTYFTCTIAPIDFNGEDHPRYIAEVTAVDADGDEFTTDDATVRFVTGVVAIQPGDSRTYRAAIYLGEKDGVAFKKIDEYQRRDYYYQISQSFGMCTFTWLVEMMIWLLNSLNLIVHDFGIAIIFLVLIVRTLLHPITKKGQVNMVRMQQKMGDFAPKLEEMKKKYANDKARLQQETMSLYREHGISPAGPMLGCLPLFLQMPIWIALFLSLSNNIQMRHEPFILFPWVNDLTAPDAMIPFSTPFTIPIFGWKIAAFNMLPFLVALFMYVQQKTQPRPKPNPNMTDQQRQQQEMMTTMMPLMSIMMLLIFYNMPSGLNLYIMFSSLFGWIEQKRIRKHIKEQEESGTFNKPKPPSGDALSKRSSKPSFFERLQKAAEDAKKLQSQRPKKRKQRR